MGESHLDANWSNQINSYESTPEDNSRRILSDSEERLREIWVGVFQRQDIGLDESFVKIGGDSLIAILCISRIRKVFGVECTIEEFLMDRSSISDFAALIDSSKGV